MPAALVLPIAASGRPPRQHALGLACGAAVALHLALWQGLALRSAPAPMRTGGHPAVVRLELRRVAVPIRPVLSPAAPPVSRPAQARRSPSPEHGRSGVPLRPPDPVPSHPALAHPRDAPGHAITAGDSAPVAVQPPDRAADAAPAPRPRPWSEPDTAPQTAEPADTGPTGPGTWPTPDALRALPRYTVRLPPAFDATVDGLRGSESANGLWRYEPQPDGRYRVVLDMQARRRPWVVLDSTGAIAEAGLQPERHEDHRRGRAAAVNFDRGAAQARFSGLAQAAPTAEAVQDRLSWLVQLSGVLAGEPALRCAGSRIWLQLVGARGSSAVWRFENQGLQALPGFEVAPARQDVGATSAQGLHLVRRPEQPYDQRAEVWLEPGGSFRPLRLRLTPVPVGAVWDLRFSLPAAPAARSPEGPGRPCT